MIGPSANLPTRHRRNQTPSTAATRLETLARQAERLRPDHRDPEAFHCQKSELVHALRVLAREVLHG
jgi:hypothetical protein